MDMRQYANAIASIESAGSGDYSAVGPQTAKGNRAYGRYQVMDFNVGPWTEKHFGTRLSPEEFLANPKAQEAVFSGEFGQYVQKYGNPQDAASMWFTGKPMSQGAGRSDILGTTGSGYVNKFNAALGVGGNMQPNNMTPMMDKEEDKTDFRDIAGNLAIAFNSLRHRPDPNVAATVQNIQQQRTAKAAQNKSIEMLRRAGRDDIANAIESGAFNAKEGVSLMFREAAALRDQQSGVKDTALIRNAVAAGLKPNTPEFQQYILSGGDVYSQETQLLATLPKPKDGFGYEFDKDETGRITNYRLVPIEGGEADIEAKQAESAAEAQREAQSTSGMVVLEDIGKALEIAKEKPFLSTGFVGGILKSVGGTAAKDLTSLTTTIKASIGFDRLQRMREESPTGGALGQVAVQELEALQATLGNLDNSQTNEQVVGNLERLQEQYTKSMQEIYNAAVQDQANGRINRKTGRVISPLDYFSEQDINTLSGAPSGGPSDEDLLKKYGG